MARELTKKFEEVLRGKATEVLEELVRKPRKGEFVIIIEGASAQKHSTDMR